MYIQLVLYANSGPLSIKNWKIYAKIKAFCVRIAWCGLYVTNDLSHAGTKDTFDELNIVLKVTRLSHMPEI